MLSQKNIKKTEKKDYLTGFGARLRSVWLDSKMSQDDFAKSVNVSSSTLKNWLSGKNSPTVDTLLEFCEKKKISFAWLAMGESSVEDGDKIDIDLLTEIMIQAEKIDTVDIRQKATLCGKIYAYAIKRRKENLSVDYASTDKVNISDIIDVIKSIS